MKVTITYKYATQISPDSFDTFTKVVHFSYLSSLADVYEELTKEWGKKDDFDGEIHFKLD